MNFNPEIIRPMVRVNVRERIRHAVARGALVEDLAARLAPALAGLKLAPSRKVAPPPRTRAPRRQREVLAEFKNGRRIA